MMVVIVVMVMVVMVAMVVMVVIINIKKREKNHNAKNNAVLKRFKVYEYILSVITYIITYNTISYKIFSSVLSLLVITRSRHNKLMYGLTLKFIIPINGRTLGLIT